MATSTTNLSCVSIDTSDHYSKHLRVTAFAIFPLMILASILGNSLLIYITAKKSTVNNAVKSYIINIAISNMIISIIPTLGFLIEVQLGKWPFGQKACDASVVIEYAALTTSTTILIMYCIQQHGAVVKPMKKPSHKYTKFLVMGAWVIGWPLATPLVVPNTRYNKSTMGCSDMWVVTFTKKDIDLTSFWIIVAIFVLLYVIPFIVMTTAYSKIIYTFLKKMKRPGWMTQSTKQRTERRKWKSIKMLVVTFLLFKVCWLPTYLQEIIMATKNVECWTEPLLIVNFVTSVMGYFYGVLYPLIYYVYMRQYREALSDIRSSCCGKVCTMIRGICGKKRLNREAIEQNENGHDKNIAEDCL